MAVFHFRFQDAPGRSRNAKIRKEGYYDPPKCTLNNLWLVYNVDTHAPSTNVEDSFDHASAATCFKLQRWKYINHESVEEDGTMGREWRVTVLPMRRADEHNGHKAKIAREQRRDTYSWAAGGSSGVFPKPELVTAWPFRPPVPNFSRSRASASRRRRICRGFEGQWVQSRTECCRE